MSPPRLSKPAESPGIPRLVRPLVPRGGGIKLTNDMGLE